MYTSDELYTNTITANEFYMRPQQQIVKGEPISKIIRNDDGSYTIVSKETTVNITHVDGDETKEHGMAWWKAMLIGLGSGTLVAGAGYFIYKAATKEGNTDLVIDSSHANSTDVFATNTLAEASVNGKKMLVCINAFNAGMKPVQLTSPAKMSVTCSEPINAQFYYKNLCVLLVDVTNWGSNSTITIKTTDVQASVDNYIGSSSFKLKLPTTIYTDLQNSNTLFDQWALVSKYRTPTLNSILITETGLLYGDLTSGGNTMDKQSSNGYDFYATTFTPTSGTSMYDIEHEIGLHCYRFAYTYTEEPVFSLFSNISREDYEHTPYKIRSLVWEVFEQGKTCYITAGEAVTIRTPTGDLVSTTTSKHGDLTVYTFVCPAVSWILVAGATTRRVFETVTTLSLPNFSDAFVVGSYAPIFTHYNYSLANVLYVYVNTNTGELATEPIQNMTRKVMTNLTPVIDGPIYNIQTEECPQLTWNDTVPLWKNPNFATANAPVSTVGHARYIRPNASAVFDVPFVAATVTTALKNIQIASFTTGPLTRVTFKKAVYKNTWDLVTFTSSDGDTWSTQVFVRNMPYDIPLTCNVIDYQVILGTNTTPTTITNEVDLGAGYYSKTYSKTNEVKYKPYSIFKAYPTLYLISSFFTNSPQDSTLTRTYAFTTMTGAIYHVYLVTTMFSDYGVCLDNVSSSSNYAMVNKTEVDPTYSTNTSLIYAPLLETIIEGPEMTLILGNSATKSDQVLDSDGKFLDYRFKMPFYTFNFPAYFEQFPYICESIAINTFFDVKQMAEANRSYPRNTAFFMTPNKQSQVEFFYKAELDTSTAPVHIAIYNKATTADLEDVVDRDPDQTVELTNGVGSAKCDQECYAFVVVGDIINTQLMGHYNPDVLKFDTYDYAYQQSRFATSTFYSQTSQVCLFPPVIGSNNKASMLLNMRRYHNDMTTSTYSSTFTPKFIVCAKNGETVAITDSDVKINGNFIRISFKVNDSVSDKVLRVCVYLPELYVVEYPYDSSISYSATAGKTLVYANSYNSTKKDVSQSYCTAGYNSDMVLSDYDLTVGNYGVPTTSFTVDSVPYNMFTGPIGNGLRLTPTYIQVGTNGGAIMAISFNPTSVEASDGSEVKYSYNSKYGVVVIYETPTQPKWITFKALSSTVTYYFHYRAAHRGKNELLTYAANGVLVFAHSQGLTGNAGIDLTENYELVFSPNMYAYESYTPNTAYYVTLNIPGTGLFSKYI